VEGARGRKLFAREPEAKPRRPALLARKPNRKIAFSFFDFARADFSFKGEGNFSARQCRLAARRRGGAIGFF